MFKTFLKNVFWFVIRAAISLLLPLVVWILLRGDGESVVYLVWSLFLFLPFWVPQLGALLWVRRLRAGLFLGLVAVLFFRIVIIPLSSYEIWFRLVPAGRASGTISSLFCGLSVLGSLLAVSFLEKKKIPAYLFALGLAAAVLAMICLQEVWTVVVSSILLLLLFAVTRGTILKKLRKGRFIVFFFPVIFALLFAWIVAPRMEPEGNRFVNRVLFSGTRAFLSSRFPEFPLLESVPGYGHGYQAVASGGRPHFTSDVLFEVKGEPGRRYYLKDSLFTQLRGDRWIYYEADFPLPPLENREEKPDLVITLRSDFRVTLPLTARTEAVAMENTPDRMITRNGSLGIDPPLIRGDSYGLYLGEEAFDQSPPPDSCYTASAASAALRDLAESLRDPEGSAWRTALNIREFLRENYSYNLDIPVSREGRLIEDFLFETKTGYCVHFSGAFIMLYRSCGFPVRQASGYLVQMPTSEEIDFSTYTGQALDRQLVSGYASHSWAEIWLEDRGWVTWETTPPLVVDMPAETEDELTLRQLSVLTGKPLPVEEKERWSFPWWIPAVLLLTALLVWFLFRLIRSQLRRMRSSSRLLLRISLVAERLGVPSPAVSGWVAWGTAAGEILERRALTRRIALTALAHLYDPRYRESRRDRRLLLAFRNYLILYAWFRPRRSTGKGSKEEAQRAI